MYTQGYAVATVASHASRTISSDAAFLLPYLKPTDRILDVGCGPGTITAGFSASVPHGEVVGVDISDEVLAQARAAAGELATDSAGRLSFVSADLLQGLPFEDGAFDVVYASQLFPHLQPQDVALKALVEMRRVLRPGGILATRDAAELHFYPRSHDLDRLWTRNMTNALCYGADDADLPGGRMPALFKKAEFDLAGGRVKVGAGTTVHSSASARRWYVDGCFGRFEDAFYRNSWLKAGTTDAEIEKAKPALEEWAENDEAWYAALQCEVIGWK